MTPSVSPRRFAAALLLLAVLARGAAFVQIGNGPASTAHLWDQSDMHFFVSLAERIVHGDVLLNGTYHPIQHAWRREAARSYLNAHPDRAAELARRARAEGTTPETLVWNGWIGEKRYYQEPLYTYLVAASLRVFGENVRWIFAWQALLGVLTVLLVYRTTARLFSETAGRVAGLLAVGYAPLLLYDFVVLRASLLAFAGIALVAVLVRAVDRDRPRAWFAAGLTLGAALLLKTVFAPLAFGAVAWTLRDARRAPGRGLRNAGAMVIGMALCLAPVAARNAAVGAPVLALASPGLANPFTGLAAGNEIRTGSSVHSFAGYGDVLEESNGNVLRAFTATIRAHGSPGAFAGHVARKMWHVWHWYEIPNNTNFYLREAESPVLRWLPVRFLLVAPLGLVGAVLWGRGHARGWPLTLALLSGFAVLVVFAHNGRHRVTLVPLMLPFCAHALVRLLEEMRHRRALRAVAIGGAALVLGWGAARPLPDGKARIRTADYAVALQTFHEPRADAAAARGDWDTAAAALRAGLRAAPDWIREPAPTRRLTAQDRALAALYVDVHRKLAAVLERDGRSAEAVPHRDVAFRLVSAYLGATGSVP